MRDEHIKDMLDGAPLASLSESELARMRSHADTCDECARAYAAARVSASMLAERATAAFEPSPFFQTRVLAALRERRAGVEGWSFSRLWKAAGVLVSSMAGAVAMLAALTFLVPQQTAMQQQVASAPDTYTADNVIFSQTDANDKDSYDEVISTLYGADDAAEK
jgi:anti-sigma factor RsiW